MSDAGVEEYFRTPEDLAKNGISRVVTSGDNDEFIHIGDTKVHRNELMAAFGGTFNPAPYLPPSRKLANPAPMGLFSFSVTTLVLSLINARARGVTETNVVVGLALFYGGIVQLLSGMWLMTVENTFGMTALGSYGAFWMSYGAILIPSFGIIDAYEDPKELGNAIGFFLTGWFIFTFIMLLCTIRSTVAFFSLLLFLDITLLLLALSNYTGKLALQKAGGWTGLITAALGFYNSYAGVATLENTYSIFLPKVIPMPGAYDIDKEE